MQFAMSAEGMEDYSNAKATYDMSRKSNFTDSANMARQSRSKARQAVASGTPVQSYTPKAPAGKARYN
jgi:hypothetical protein